MEVMKMRLDDGILVADNSSLGRDVKLNIHNNRPRGVVSAYIAGTNIPLFEKRENKVICDGSMFTASKHFNMAPPISLPTYNDSLNLEAASSVTATERLDSLVYLFCVGTSGCGPEQSQVYDVDYTKWIAPEDLVPIRYQLADNDLSDTDREKYFGRKEITSMNRVAYYFKGFDVDPQFKAQYTDGTPIDENLYLSDNVIDVEVYVELKMSITKRDCRDYFIAHSGINDAKINCISLCTAYPKQYNGHTYYQGIRPLTRLNFSNESLIDQTKGIDIIYDLFY
jgi:hypothetical protein